MRTFPIDADSIQVARGERFVLEAPARPTAGYRWSVGACELVRQVEVRYVPSTGDVGGGSRQQIVLEALEPGTGTLELRYAQAGSSTAKEERSVRVVVGE